ncbi:hypothetical protein SLEP1_g50882 [Rubroshorea leprosula]|uniref:Uncharacterized protein n=1 Tax=Rubroshorea leprosula TaxID=152421 RepID=A0AAV5M3J8_9ROSI|nr:hypothetical protein SLEP1_g50882 [Rubroshorea leprosula]
MSSLICLGNKFPPIEDLGFADGFETHMTSEWVSSNRTALIPFFRSIFDLSAIAGFFGHLPHVISGDSSCFSSFSNSLRSSFILLRSVSHRFDVMSPSICLGLDDPPVWMAPSFSEPCNRQASARVFCSSRPPCSRTKRTQQLTALLLRKPLPDLLCSSLCCPSASACGCGILGIFRIFLANSRQQPPLQLRFLQLENYENPVELVSVLANFGSAVTVHGTVCGTVHEHCSFTEGQQLTGI